MRRWIALLLVMVLLPWQVLGWASISLSHGSDESHAVAHWAGEAHHHHDAHDHDADGFHEDDSEESIQHIVQTDAYLTPVAALPGSVKVTPGMFVEVAPPALHAQPCSPPFLEGLRRPPRSSC